MKFEEVLPALREGKTIRHKERGLIKAISEDYVIFSFVDGYPYLYRLSGYLLSDDWEIIEEKKKVKLRDLTLDQFRSWKRQNCHAKKCKDCVFDDVNCFTYSNSFWIKNKDRYNNKFLDQEIEVEE